MANKIQIKRGLESNINRSNLSQGELAVTIDSNKLYVGTSKGPIQLNKDDESLVIIDYYETDESKKEKIKSLFLKEDGSISEHQLVKPSILLAPTIEPTDQTLTYTIGQYVCGFGDTESKIIEPTGKQITKYTLIFTSMAIDGGIYLTYNVSGDTLTYTWVKSPVIQSDYNQNDSTAKDYIKNRPFYDSGISETLLDLTNPTLETWNVCKTFENNNDVLDFMNNLKVSNITLTVDNSSENCGNRLEIPSVETQQFLSRFNFPSDLYDVTNSTPYALSFISSGLGILFVNCIDNKSNYVILYYIASFVESTVPSIQKLLLTGYRSELKQIQDKFVYSVVDVIPGLGKDSSSELDEYMNQYEENFIMRNNLTDSNKTNYRPNPVVAINDDNDLYLVSFNWEDHSQIK